MSRGYRTETGRCDYVLCDRWMVSCRTTDRKMHNPCALQREQKNTAAEIIFRRKITNI